MELIKKTIKDNLLSSGYFIDNKYLDEYVNLLYDNLDTPKEFLTQQHHKLPRHHFKRNNIEVDNSIENLVNLSFSDHMKAHYLLSLCCANEKDRLSNEAALIRMVGKKPVDPTNFEEYNDLYNEYQLHNRNTHLGRTHNTSEITRNKIGQANKGKYLGHIHIYKDSIEKHIPKDQLQNYLNDGWQVGRPESVINNLSTNYNYNVKGMLGRSQSDYQKSRVSQALKGVPKSDVAKSNMSNAHKDKILVSNEITKKSLYINKEDLDLYISQGFHRGRLNK